MFDKVTTTSHKLKQDRLTKLNNRMKAEKEPAEVFDKVTTTADKLLAAGYHSVFSDKREGKNKKNKKLNH